MMLTQPASAAAPWLDRIVIRRLVKADLPALEWDGEFRHFRRLYQDVYQNYTLGRALMWVAELPGVELVGQLFIQLASSWPEPVSGDYRPYEKAYIYGFRVKPAYRGFGLGTRMMQCVEDDLHYRGFSGVCLNVSQDNSGARRLYERLGYRVVSVEPGRWSYIDDQGRRQDVHEPAWRMEKEIGQPTADC
jgi:ribosomal protein S18 acetylase RimI-like enzyme